MPAPGHPGGGRPAAMLDGGRRTDRRVMARPRDDRVGTDRERLRRAYESTTYWVDDGPRGRFAIRVGARSDDADALLAAAGADAWAFVTACNPRSVVLADADNAARMAQLAQALRSRGFAHLAGASVADAGDWPAEPSLLVVGLAEDEAVALARGFGQHALVVGRRGEPARLVWIEAAGPGG